MRACLARIAGGLNINPEGARLLRLTNNAVFALPAAGLVVRITRSHALHERAQKNAALGGWFATVDAPTIRLAEHVEQPIVDGALLATVWHWLPPTAPPPDTGDLGTALREWRALGLPPFPLPDWDPIGDARTRISDAEALDDADRDYLLRWCDRLEPRLHAFTAGADRSLIHGDAWTGNLLRTPEGRVVWCDFDATAAGPWQVDLVPAPVSELRFARSGHARLAAAYGYDITTDPAWPLLREARELKAIAAGAPLLASAPGVAAQFRLRLNSIRDHDLTARWTAYGDLTNPGTASERVPGSAPGTATG